MIAPDDELTIPPLADAAVTDAPFTALVPISIFTLPDEAARLDMLPRSMMPLPDTTMLSTGRIRPRTMIPLIVPDADPGNVSFQLILVVSAPLHCTVPLPMTDAQVSEILLDTSVRDIAARVTAPTRTREFIYV